MTTRPSRIRSRPAHAIVAAAIGSSTLAANTPALAGLTEASWLSGQSGQWTDPAKWSTNPFYPNDGTPAGSLYHAWINPPDAAAPFTVNMDASARVQILTLDAPLATFAHGGGGTFTAATLATVAAGTLQLAGGTFDSLNVTSLSTAATMRVLGGAVAKSNFLFSRGTVHAGPGSVIDVGTYDQTGGATDFAGGTVRVNTAATQTGGTAMLSAGSLTSRGYRLTFGARFDHLAGAEHIAFAGPSIGGGSTYAMSGGTLTAHDRFEVGVNGDGTFLLTGGTVPRPNVPFPFEIRANVIGGVGASGPGNGTMIIDGPQTQFVRAPGATIWRFNAIGAGSQSTGTVIVRNGATADLEQAQVGLGGVGTLRIESGAQVTATLIDVGHTNFNWTGMPFPSLGRGTVILDGATSRLELINPNSASVSFVNVGAGTMMPGGLGSGTMLLNAGTFVINRGKVEVGTFGTVRVDGANVFVQFFENHGSTVFASGSFTTERLDVFGGLFRVTPGADKTVYTTRFTGRMDLGDNRMIQDYGAGSISPINPTRNGLRNGLNSGGSVGLFSSVAVGDPGHRLAYAEATDLFSTFPATFGGYTIDNTAVLVLYGRIGDANIDGVVNLDDFNRLAASFGATAGAVWTSGDFDYNGNVNLQDFNLLAANFGMSASGPDVTPDDWAALAMAVPEPVGAAVGLVLLTLVGRRRRRSR